MNEEILVQFVSNIDDDIVVSSRINSRTRKLAINSYNLQSITDIRTQSSKLKTWQLITLNCYI